MQSHWAACANTCLQLSSSWKLFLMHSGLIGSDASEPLGNWPLSFLLCLPSSPVSNSLAKLPLLSLRYRYIGESNLYQQGWRQYMLVEEQKVYQFSKRLNYLKICKWKCILYFGTVTLQNIRMLYFWSCFMSQNVIHNVSWSCLAQGIRENLLMAGEGKMSL